MQATRVQSIEPYRDPVGGPWNARAALAVPMTRAPIGMQPTEYIRVKWAQEDYGHSSRIAVSAVHDGEQFAVHLEWEAPAQDERDAVAVALPVRGKPYLVTMGDPEQPIHFLHWIAGCEGLRSTVATGIGTTRPGPEFRRSAQALWQDGHWQVVLVRPLGAGGGVAPLAAGRPAQIAFAVWQGANAERAGLKAFSINWKDMALDA
ncbi:MAG: hypothetical protein IT495_06065 [Gammaproteobacteria bacterium]|nr:hypothetical protein [Gammaproteobacteria bacterium]